MAVKMAESFHKKPLYFSLFQVPSFFDFMTLRCTLKL